MVHSYLYMLIRLTRPTGGFHRSAASSNCSESRCISIVCKSKWYSRNLQGGPAAQNAIAAGPAWDQNPRKAAATAAAVDLYNSGNRQKSLLEQHQDKKSKKRKADTAKAAVDNSQGSDSKMQQGADGNWKGKHPWRPFDREKDLNVGAKPVSQQDLLKKAGSLTGRFGGPVGQRTFL